MKATTTIRVIAAGTLLACAGALQAAEAGDAAAGKGKTTMCIGCHGIGGTIKYSLHGLVDIRLALILLAGSLFGVQLGAIGTTFVKPYLIKVVMAAIMLIVAVSRGLVVPVYLTQLGRMDLAPQAMAWLQTASFAFLVLALLTGGVIIIGAMLRGYRTAEAPLRREAVTE